MRTSHERLRLALETPFGISRGTVDAVENVVVRVATGDSEGVGAAAPAPHYGETADTVEAVVDDLLAVVERVDDPHALARVERGLLDVVCRNPSARAAVSVACHDLAAADAGLPLYRYLGLDPTDAPPTSFTVGIDDTDRMREKAARAVGAGYDLLKVKVGTGRDEEILRAVREAAPDARIRVDANEAWTPREAVARIETAAAHGVEFVEQPIPAGDPDALRFVRERSPLPVAADESCVSLDDVPRLAGCVDVVNLKLMKCGGVREAVRMVHAARAHGLEVMLGCMIETNAAVAAAMHLAPLFDYVDLDGSLLLADDPYAGVPTDGGDIELAAATDPGTGARRV